ncbi:hypothetical protein [Psittacicella gerlachiana]|uniref:Uncharacterized protein n=1 Tax=Psittacicella gerlachiana TaxID=2028574 RepID=A0A3A1Y3Y1_9GAMM|nr:hypothetical protein [Psittacicella gerlachiana]RIY32120.1 hypothetical protein CKF59_07170 [Psittacicella gerlachiana]
MKWKLLFLLFCGFALSSVAQSQGLSYQRIVGSQVEVEAASSFNYAAAYKVSQLDEQGGRFIGLKFRKFDGSRHIVLTDAENKQAATKYQIGLITITIADNVSLLAANTLLKDLGMNFELIAHQEMRSLLVPLE